MSLIKVIIVISYYLAFFNNTIHKNFYSIFWLINYNFTSKIVKKSIPFYSLLTKKRKHAIIKQIFKYIIPQTDRGGDFMEKRYKCSLCGRSGVKLWRPYWETEILVCASCAEKRQSPLTFNEYTWELKTNGEILGTPTGKVLEFPKWKVDEKGKIPYRVAFSVGSPNPIKTDQLSVDLSKDFPESFPSKETSLIPAVPKGEDSFWGYTSVPESQCQWWEQLPTR